ncbi:hypothetical protein GUITHDRAFT_120987 [Guillardia theta CCMP2712]|uniref:Uncharacterized protein n=1 Tax=Guillardia theta (strain CCMP2712) TaxID=905079 RepID=L1I9C0_GUITC|nr:hypothetical protein GUITHDRAFT_120987 [Guillardia theta CCMP2712]EKX32836.1 hypothetical protein GUITHDRAFT_120987 [Guillardia theta CCMP2712]|eukprot:XP_005819816.1 hypothetical protein GUITHDRAFT_120987 [Guillardia theta CCMP2712]
MQKTLAIGTAFLAGFLTYKVWKSLEANREEEEREKERSSEAEVMGMDSSRGGWGSIQKCGTSRVASAGNAKFESSVERLWEHAGDATRAWSETFERGVRRAVEISEMTRIEPRDDEHDDDVEFLAPFDQEQLANGVWKVEDGDYYTSAGGREVSMEEMKRILLKDNRPVTEFWKNRYETEARRCWDVFYKVNENRFFKDRHYLDKEWNCLRDAKLKIIEVGCGVGNTILPLLEVNPTAQIWGCDFSENAISILQTSEGYDKSRCTSFVNDITKDALLEHVSQVQVHVTYERLMGSMMVRVVVVDEGEEDEVEDGEERGGDEEEEKVEAASMDLCLMIFVLSAISPEKMVRGEQEQK